MPVDPDDMLIFRMRHMPMNAKVVPRQTVQSKPQSSQGSSTAQIQHAQPTQSAPAQAQKAVQPMQQPRPSIQQSKPVPSPDRRKPASTFKETEEPMFVAPTVSSAVIEEAVETAGGDISETIGKKATKSRSEQQSEEAAIGLSCVWHPWRPAYAICNYCHRPFCFEDIVEQKGHYYCLEDIDKVATSDAGEAASGKISYVGIGTIAGILYVASFLLFILFASGALSSAISYSNSVGLFTFLSTAKLSQLLVILESAVMLLAFVAGFLMLLKARVAIIIAPLSSVLSIIMFGYGYFAYGTLYALALAAVSIVAIVLYAYSLVGMNSQQIIEEKSKGKDQATEVQFANVGRF